MNTTVLQITGMNCGACVAPHVTKPLSTVPGVRSVKVDRRPAAPSSSTKGWNPFAWSRQ